jgi:hypothetical protein
MTRHKSLLTTAVLSLCFFLGVGSLSAQNIGFGLGLSTPDDQLNDVYNRDRLENNSDLYDLFRESTALGFHLQGRVLVDMGESVDFTAGIGIHQFPDSEIIVLGANNDTLGSFETKQNVIPISAGIEYTLFRKMIGLYVAGEVNYNYFINSVSNEQLSVPLPLEETEYFRGGVSLGFGIDVATPILTADVGVRYNILNIIGKEAASEEQKSFVSLTAMIYLGQKSQ